MRIALIQMSVTEDREQNIQTACEKIREAAAGGADFAVLPEMFCCPYDNDCFRPYGEEADGPATIAQMVRFHAEKYPAATPFTYFFGTPYNWTREQFMLALEQLRKIPDYEDIVEVHAYDDTPFLISTKFVTEKYGKALADFGQESTESM